jgi:hypothetical protein
MSVDADIQDIEVVVPQLQPVYIRGLPMVQAVAASGSHVLRLVMHALLLELRAIPRRLHL